MSVVQEMWAYLCFDGKAEEAVAFYTSIFADSRINTTSRYGKAGFEQHHMPAGSVMTIAFELDGQAFTALNGGPVFKFNEAVSLQVNCTTQEEIDYFWDKLSDGGDPAARQCGWLKDRYGVSWQIVPQALEEMVSDPDPVKADRVMAALMPMKKLIIADLNRAYAG